MTQTPDFASKPTLAGERVILRPFIDADLPALREALADPDLLHPHRQRPRRGGSPPARQPGGGAAPPGLVRHPQRHRRPARPGDRRQGDRRLRRARRCSTSGTPGNQSCNFRIQIGPAGQNRGLGTEATRLIVGYGFEQLGLHRISLEVYAFNPRARRAYEKAGFRVEGVLRESLRYGDQWIDATVMSILAPEWPPVTATQG